MAKGEPATGPAAGRLPRYRARLLGAFSLTDLSTGKDVTPKSRKARALLAYLTLHNSGTAKRERLAGILWGDRGEDQARASLRQTLHELRSLSDGEVILVNSDREDVTLVRCALATDLSEIEELVRKGDIPALDKALAQWTERPLLADLNAIDIGFDEWVSNTREAVQTRLIDAILSLVERANAHDDAGVLRSIGTHLQRLDPLNERVLRLLMGIDYKAGDTASIHRRYGRFVERLREEVNAPPSQETQRQFRELTSRSSHTAAIGENEPQLLSAALAGDAPSISRAVAHANSAGVPDHDVGHPQVVTRQANWAIVLGGATALFACIVVAALWLWPSNGVLPSQKADSAAPVPFVAVLAFDNASDMPGLQFLSDGVSDEIIAMLSKFRGIEVVARNSTFAFRGAQKQEAAAMLGVTHVLDGTVRRDNEKLHVTAQLSNARTGAVLWSQIYDRRIEDRGFIEGQIVREVSRLLRLTSTSGSSLEPRVDPIAFEFYLRAREAIRQRTAPASTNAVAMLTESVRIAPTFSRGWSSLSWAQLLVSGSLSRADHPDEALKAERAAEQAAQRAIELDPKSAEPYLTLATQAQGYGYDAKALALIDKGLSLEPLNADLIRARGLNELALGYVRDAISDLRRSNSLDPMEPRVWALLISALRASGQKAEAKQMLEKAIARFPMYVHVWRVKLRASIVDGRYDEAEAMLSPKVARPDAWTESQVAPSLALVKVLRSHDPPKIEKLARELRDKAIADVSIAGEAPWQLVILGRYEDAYELLQENYPRTYSGGGRSLPDEEAGRRLWVGYEPEFYGDFALRAFRRDRRFLLIYDHGNALDYWRAIGKWPDFCADPTLRYDCKVEAEKRIAARPTSH